MEVNSICLHEFYSNKFLSCLQKKKNVFQFTLQGELFDNNTLSKYIKLNSLYLKYLI